MARYRLFATDLDGTLFGADLRIGRRTQRALASLADHDCQLVLATGRMFQATLPFARQLAINTPLITYQGALIRHPLTLEDSWHHRLSPALALELLAALGETGMHVNLYLDDRLYLKALSSEALGYIGLARVPYHLCDAWGDILDRRGPGPTKIVAIGPEECVIRWATLFKEQFAGRLFITPSQPTFLEFAHPRAGKGAALAKVAALLGVLPAEVVAVGDGLNDLDLIDFAGLGVAVGNAHPTLKAAADRVTGPMAEEGVASLIENLISEGLFAKPSS